MGIHAALCVDEEHVGTAEGFDGLGKCALGRKMARGQCKGSQCCCGCLLLLALACFRKRKKGALGQGIASEAGRGLQ